MACKVSNIGMGGGKELVAQTTTSVAASTETTFYTATEPCCITLQATNTVYCRINGTASWGENDFVLGQTGSEIGINSASLQLIAKKQINYCQVKGGYICMSVNLNAGDYISVLNRSSSSSVTIYYTVYTA